MHFPLVETAFGVAHLCDGRVTYATIVSRSAAGETKAAERNLETYHATDSCSLLDAPKHRPLLRR